jgi:hypothetical protein
MRIYSINGINIISEIIKRAKSFEKVKSSSINIIGVVVAITLSNINLSNALNKSVFYS